MDLQTSDSRYDLGVGMTSTVSDGLETAQPMAADGQSRLGAVIALVGLGLLLVGVSDALGRNDHLAAVVPLFLAGMALIFGPCAWRLTGTAASRNERVWVSVVLGVGLLASYTLRSPLIFDNFDELAHSATLMRLLDSRTLFPNNPILPVSPYFPGIELVTISAKWVTGLPLLIDQMIVLLVARVVLVLCVFLVVERACRSARAGGVGVLVYAAGPEFYSLGAQYGYQTLALTFAAAIVYLLFVSIDAPHPKRGRLFALALVSIGAMVVSHHLTAWLAVSFLVVWAAALRFIHDPRRGFIDSTLSRTLPNAPLTHSPSPIESWDAHRERRKQQSRVIGLAALVGVVLVGAWITFVGHVLTGYVGPILQEGVDSAAEMLGQFHGNRKLFQNSAGGGTPGWESALILAAAVAFCLILLVSLYSVLWKKSVRGGRLRYLPAVIAATYPLALLTNISTDAKLVGARSTTFIFFGMAVVIGGWQAKSLLSQRRTIVRVATIGVAVICFLGSTIYGGGPLPGLVNGPYIVGAHERSLGPPSFALANWASNNLPAGSHVAVDRDNGALLNDIGHVEPVSPLNGSNDPAPLFFDRQLTPSDLALIRKDDIRYVVTDTRLTEGLPLYGAYIAPGETRIPTRLTAAELQKFDSIPGVIRIYDNGAIQVYDVSRLMGKRPLPIGKGSPGESVSGTDVPVLIVAGLVSFVWLIRLRRRAQRARINEHQVVCGLVGALVIGLFGAFAIRLLHLRPTPVALLALLILLVVGVWPAVRKRSVASQNRPLAGMPSGSVESADEPRSMTVGSKVRRFEAARTSPARTGKANSPRRARANQIALGCVGLALFAVGATFATAAARKDQVTPAELSMNIEQVRMSIASVDLGSAAPVSARLEVERFGRTVWSTPLSSGSTWQRVAIPSRLDHSGASAVLVAGGAPIRSVSLPGAP
jgi:hypothetical protein